MDTGKINFVITNYAFNHSIIPQFIIDKNHKIVFWNKALEKISNLKAEDMIGTNQHWKAFYEHERPCMADILIDNQVDKLQKLYEGKIKQFDLVDGIYEATDYFPNLGKDGVWLQFTASLIKDDSGEILAAIETLENVTDIKKNEETLKSKLEELEKLNKFMVDREIRMLELKNEMAEMRTQIEQLKTELASLKNK